MNNHVIVAGSTKCGTTSLYRYLADHPEVTGSIVKETRYFLQREHALAIEDNCESRRGSYKSFWPSSGATHCMVEATPDYMTSPGVWGRIKKEVPGAHVIICLRDPIKRLESWYRYGIQQALIPEKTTLESYLDVQLGEGPQSISVHPCFSALEHGRFVNYLEELYTKWSDEKVILILAEELRKDPVEVLKNIAKTIGINPDFYDEYQFRLLNKTRATRWPLAHKALSDAYEYVLKITRKIPRMAGAMKKVRNWARPVYWLVNGSSCETQVVRTPSEDVYQHLGRYYSKSLERLYPHISRERLARAGWSLPEDSN